MADFNGPNRVKKLRERRKSAGFVETNVSIPAEVREAIDSSVAEGVYPTRRSAIIAALQKEFCKEDQPGK